MRKLSPWHFVSTNILSGACSGLDAIDAYPELPRSSSQSSPSEIVYDTRHDFGAIII